MNKNFFKTLSVNILIFAYIVVVLVNFFHNSHNSYIKSEELSQINNKEVYLLKKETLKEDISNSLTLKNASEFYLDRECKITGSMHDRHKVRWVKNIVLDKIYKASLNLNKTLPYYVNIFIHSLLIFLSLIILNKAFVFNERYHLLFLVYVTFIFQQYLGEYSYSIFEMFFLTLAIYSSKNKNIYLFIISCLFAVLNRESGFLILLTWFIFNSDFKNFIIAIILTLSVFFIANIDLKNCLLNPKFFIPLENQVGQINFDDTLNNNLFSNIKLFFVNFILPFGLFLYFYIQCANKNKFLLLLVILYFLTFIFATPAHHVAVRLLLLPLIISAIYFKNLSKTVD